MQKRDENAEVTRSQKDKAENYQHVFFFLFFYSVTKYFIITIRGTEGTLLGRLDYMGIKALYQDNKK